MPPADYMWERWLYRTVRAGVEQVVSIRTLLPLHGPHHVAWKSTTTLVFDDNIFLNCEDESIIVGEVMATTREFYSRT